LEGGDVLRVGRTIFAGRSLRSNAEGIQQLKELAAPIGYEVREVEVRGCMHLKTGCCYLGDDTMLVNRDWIDSNALGGFRLIDVPREEPWAANVLTLGQTIVMPDSALATRQLLEQRGLTVQTLDISELAKAEAGLTCMSILLEATARPLRF
jgi:dimethylargininase